LDIRKVSYGRAVILAINFVEITLNENLNIV